MNQIDDRLMCNICNRKFAPGRLEKHFEICRKQKEKKRHVFDSSKQRLILNSNEILTNNSIQFDQQSTKVVNNNKSKNKVYRFVNTSSINNNNTKVCDWRKKHEYFIQAIRTVRNSFNFKENNQLKNYNLNINNFEKNQNNLDLNNSIKNIDSELFMNNLSIKKINLENKNSQATDEEQCQNNKFNPISKIPKTKPIKSKTTSSILNTKNQTSNKEFQNNSNIFKKINTAYIECKICRRKFNKPAAERHIPWCVEQQLRTKKSSSNQEALARFRARNGYKACKLQKKKETVPNNQQLDKFKKTINQNYDLSNLNNLNEVLNSQNFAKTKSNLNPSKVGNLDYLNNKKATKSNQIKLNNDISKSSSASSKTSNLTLLLNNNPNEPKSRVKVRLDQQQKLNEQRMQSNHSPKTPIMKFKEKFPNHNNKLIEFTESNQFREIFKNHLNNNSQIELNNLPKTVPGVRTSTMSPVRYSKHYINGQMKNLENINDLEQLRARIKEMYLNSNDKNNYNQVYLIEKNEKIQQFNSNQINNQENDLNDFLRDNSAKLKSSRSVNDFLTLSNEIKLSNNLIATDIELPKICHQCQTNYATLNAKYCYECGARRIGTINTFIS